MAFVGVCVPYGLSLGLSNILTPVLLSVGFPGTVGRFGIGHFTALWGAVTIGGILLGCVWAYHRREIRPRTFARSLLWWVCFLIVYLVLSGDVANAAMGLYGMGLAAISSPVLPLGAALVVLSFVARAAREPWSIPGRMRAVFAVAAVAVAVLLIASHAAAVGRRNLSASR